jgi:hypothetical protein
MPGWGRLCSNPMAAPQVAQTAIRKIVMLNPRLLFEMMSVSCFERLPIPSVADA